MLSLKEHLWWIQFIVVMRDGHGQASSATRLPVPVTSRIFLNALMSVARSSSMTGRKPLMSHASGPKQWHFVVSILADPKCFRSSICPEVHSGAGQVRIRNQAATVNPTDTLLCSGARAEQMKAGPPFYVPGAEAAGIVDEVGPGVATGIKPGDAALVIMFPKASQGAYREQLVLDARSVVRAPAGKSRRRPCRWTASPRGAPKISQMSKVGDFSNATKTDFFNTNGKADVA
jgi:hypothetical protein